MRKKPKRFTKEFIAEAVKLVTEQNYTQIEAANNLGISSKNLSRWIKQASTIKQEPKGELKLSAEQEEIQRLREEVKRLKLEREILKKAAAFFANEST